MKTALKSAKNRTLRSFFRAQLAVEELESRALPSVYSPLQITTAYGINQISLASGAVNSGNLGAGETIAIVDAYYDPSIQADLNTFSQKYGLAPLNGLNGNGTFTQVDLSHKTLSPAGDDWTVETALDVEWAHAVAPKANIVLVESLSDNQDASTSEPTDLLNAVQYAATQTGAQVVSMSWGINEVPGETSWDSFFTTPGVTFVAASGDSGAGTIWPAVAPNVVSVGGTSLNLTKTNTIASETGWGTGVWSYYFGGSGGGFSQYEPLPSYQANSGISPTYTQFGARLNPDVAYDANPSTGYHVYDGADGGLLVVGGTSAGAPQWAALVAIADQARAVDHLPSLSSSQTLNTLYANSGDFHDITRGSTGYYYVTDSFGNIIGEIPVTAARGYDLVTGLGSPIANEIVPALAALPAQGAVTPLAKTLALSSGSSGAGSGRSSHFDSLGTSNPAPTSNVPVIVITFDPFRVSSAGLIVNSTESLVLPVALSPAVVPVAPPPTPSHSRYPTAFMVPLALEGFTTAPGTLPISEALPLPAEVVPAPRPQAPVPDRSTPEFNPGAEETLFLQESLVVASALVQPLSEQPSAAVEMTFAAGASVALVGLAFAPASSRDRLRKRMSNNKMDRQWR